VALDWPDHDALDDRSILPFTNPLSIGVRVFGKNPPYV
jgi:hypothetical protein